MQTEHVVLGGADPLPAFTLDGMGLRFLLARVLGRADGEAVRKCPVCGEFYPRRAAVWGLGVGSCCSDACAEVAFEKNAY